MGVCLLLPSRKERKIASYRSTLSTVWLLVIVEMFEAGELVTAAAAVTPFTVATAFDRVFAFHWLSGRVAEVPVSPHHAVRRRCDSNSGSGSL